ncbi:MAG TPA: Rid family hydrolase [Acidimicrobiales bacterium]|jgi:enamine deaminase RidA (YjgF/YER057c/UK114 family)
MGQEDVNPWEWSKAFGFSQAVKLTDTRELLVCSGQTAMGPDGSLPPSADMGQQVRTALENVVAVLEAGGMTPANIVRSNIYTTDVDACIGVLGSTVQEVLGSILPASTLLGVNRLAFPELLVEIEVIAAR